MSFSIQDQNPFTGIDFAMSLDRRAEFADNRVMELTATTPVHLIHVDPDINMARFYGIELQPTLFGEVSVLRTWGRIGTNGQAMMVTYDDEAQAGEALQNLEKQKRRRGYVPLAPAHIHFPATGPRRLNRIQNFHNAHLRSPATGAGSHSPSPQPVTGKPARLSLW